MKEKSVTFTKGKSDFLQNHRGEMGVKWKRKTGNYHRKLNVQVASRIVNNLGLMILGNEELLRLFT